MPPHDVICFNSCYAAVSFLHLFTHTTAGYVWLHVVMPDTMAGSVSICSYTPYPAGHPYGGLGCAGLHSG
jgi:hypothetical protein